MEERPRVHLSDQDGAQETALLPGQGTNTGPVVPAQGEEKRGKLRRNKDGFGKEGGGRE